MFNYLNIIFIQIWTNFKICIWGLTGIVICCSRPHLNLPWCVALVLHHLLPWVASSRFVMHHACCASCLVHVWCVYYVVCFFSIVPVSLRSWGFVRLCLIHLRGFIRSSSSWTRSSSLRVFRKDDRYPGSHYYHCYASCFVLSLRCATYHLFIKPPILPWTSNLWYLSYANHCLAMLPLCSALL